MKVVDHRHARRKDNASEACSLQPRVVDEQSEMPDNARGRKRIVPDANHGKIVAKDQLTIDAGQMPIITQVARVASASRP